MIIETGTYTIGSNEEEALFYETPEIQVALTAYELEYVTWADWEAFLRYKEILDKSRILPADPKQMNEPVISVTWHEAMEYIKVFGGKLPTEAQMAVAVQRGKLPNLWWWCLDDWNNNGLTVLGSQLTDPIYKEPADSQTKLSIYHRRHAVLRGYAVQAPRDGKDSRYPFLKTNYRRHFLPKTEFSGYVGFCVVKQNGKTVWQEESEEVLF